MQYFNELFSRWYAEHDCFNEGFDTGNPFTYNEILERINCQAPRYLFGRTEFQTPYSAMTQKALEKEIYRMNEEYRASHSGEDLFKYGKRGRLTTVAYKKHWTYLPCLEKYSEYPNFYRALLESCGFKEDTSTINGLARKLILDCIDAKPIDVSFFADDVYSVKNFTLRQLAEACIARKPLGLTIQGDLEEQKIIFHPQMLREYLGGWYLFGLEGSTNSRGTTRPRIIPTNDILQLTPLKETLFVNYSGRRFPDSDFFQFGKERRPSEGSDVLLQLRSPMYKHYFDDFPLHYSQRISGDMMIIRCPVNEGLVAQILYHADRLIVVAPEELKEMVENEISKVKHMLTASEHISEQNGNQHSFLSE